MIDDIERPEVKDVAVAIVREENELGVEVWFAYLINLKPTTLTGVLVSSRGYGVEEETGEKLETSVLRHFLDTVEPKSYVKIETVIEDVFSLSNEYWVSFYLGRDIYDKKYIFLAESIVEQNFIRVPILGKTGVMIK